MVWSFTKTFPSPFFDAHSYTSTSNPNETFIPHFKYSQLKQMELLLYKGWITKKQWLRYVYIYRFNKIIKSYRINFKPLINRKTYKSTTPIKRYKQKRRK